MKVVEVFFVIINNKVLVCYLFTKFDEYDDLSKFIDNYNSFSSGYNHKLVICFKLSLWYYFSLIMGVQVGMSDWNKFYFRSDCVGLQFEI